MKEEPEGRKEEGERRKKYVGIRMRNEVENGLSSLCSPSPLLSLFLSPLALSLFHLFLSYLSYLSVRTEGGVPPVSGNDHSPSPSPHVKTITSFSKLPRGRLLSSSPTEPPKINSFHAGMDLTTKGGRKGGRKEEGGRRKEEEGNKMRLQGQVDCVKGCEGIEGVGESRSNVYLKY